MLLDTNVYDCLYGDAEAREWLARLIAADRVCVIATPKVHDELAAGPFGGIPDWFPVQQAIESVAVVNHWRVGEAALGDGQVFAAHRGESKKVADAIIADSANTYADTLVPGDERLRKRFTRISRRCAALDFDEFRVWLKELDTIAQPARNDQRAPTPSGRSGAGRIRNGVGGMEAGRIQFALRGIGTELKDRLLAVPIYQRSYAWTSDEVREYWSDLRGAFSDNAQEYWERSF